jgi:RNA polymerase sigma-70 factor, ECF subfamily
MRTMQKEKRGALVAFPSPGTVFGLESLVERASAGDHASFRELFERYHDRVWRYGYLRLGRSEDANDLVQDVFLSIWQLLPTFRYEHEGSFPALVFRIAARRVSDRARQRARRPAVPLEEAPEASMEFEGGAVSRRVLVEALARIPENQREVVVLRFVVGLPTREIAEALGKSESAITALQMRGLQRLRRYMEQDDGDER